MSRSPNFITLCRQRSANRTTRPLTRDVQVSRGGRPVNRGGWWNDCEVVPGWDSGRIRGETERGLRRSYVDEVWSTSPTSLPGSRSPSSTRPPSRWWTRSASRAGRSAGWRSVETGEALHRQLLLELGLRTDGLITAVDWPHGCAGPAPRHGAHGRWRAGGLCPDRQRAVPAGGAGMAQSSRARLGHPRRAHVPRVAVVGPHAGALRPARLWPLGRLRRPSHDGARARHDRRGDRGARHRPAATSWAGRWGRRWPRSGPPSSPETVSRLVLYGGWATGAAIGDEDSRRHMLGLLASHWGLGSDLLTDLFAPDADAGTRLRARPLPARRLLGRDSGRAAAARLRPGRAPGPRAGPGADARAAPARRPSRSDRPGQGARRRDPGRRARGARGPLAPARLRGCRSRWSTRYGASSACHGCGGPCPPGSPPRQTEVAALVADGLTNRQLADRLGITERSAESHLERIRLRLGFRSRSQVAAWYVAQHPHK